MITSSIVRKIWARIAGRCPPRDQLGVCPYSQGKLHIRPGLEATERLQEYIARCRFLQIDDKDSIPTRNKQHRVYSINIPGIDKDLILKVFWVNPDYPFRRRIELWFSHFLKNRCKRAFRGALALEKAGITTARPLAYWTWRKSWCQIERYLLSERIPHEFSVLEYYRGLTHKGQGEGEVLDILIEKMADMLADLHRNDLRHDDIALGNVLVSLTRSNTGRDARPTYDIAIVDTDCVTRSRMPIGFVKRFFDLKCTRRLNMDKARRKFFLQRYLGNGYSEFWWGVHSFWHKGASRPLRTLYRSFKKRSR